MFDRTPLSERPAFHEADFLHAAAAEELVARLGLVSRRFETGLLCAPRSAAIDAAFAQTGIAFRRATPTPLEGTDVAADLRLPFRGAFPLAIALNDLHLSDDPVAALGELRGSLVPDGLFLGAVLASGSLVELSEALIAAETELSGGAGIRLAPFGDVRRWGDALAKAGFALPVADELRLTVRYAGIRPLVRDLERMGARRVLAERRVAPRRLFERAEAIWRERSGDPDGRMRVTFALAFLSGWAPDPSQQQPAKRGSATVRLADALKATPR